MKVFTQPELLSKIIQLARLPKDRKTKNVLSKNQMLALYLFLEKNKDAMLQLKQRELDGNT